MGFTVTGDDALQFKLFWAAVLRRAVFDYVLYKGKGHKRHVWQHAYRFLFSYGVKYDNGLSFEEVCDLMGWDPGYVRKLTMGMTRADIKKMEFNSYKEELTFQDQLTLAAENTARWKGNKFAVPRFPPYNFPPDIRRQFSLTPVYQPYQRARPNLQVRWCVV